MKKVLVTGATGFIGRHLVKELLRQGYKVRALSRNIKVTNEEIETVQGDITNKASLKEACSGVDYILHLAALTNLNRSVTNQLAFFRKINVEGTKNLLDSCSDVKRFIHFSSVDALGLQNKILYENSPAKPVEPYEITKLESEFLVRKYEKEQCIPATIIRPSCVYGEGELAKEMKINVAVLQMCKMIKKHRFPVIGSGRNLLPFTHVKNVVDGTVLALSSKLAAGETYNLSDARSYSLNEIVRTIARILNVKFPGFHIPLSIAYPTAIFFELMEKTLGINAPLTRQGIQYITCSRAYSIQKAKRELNYKPIDLSEGLKRTISWYKFKGYL